MSEQMQIPSSNNVSSGRINDLLKLVPYKTQEMYDKLKANRQKVIDLMIKESGNKLDRTTAEKILDSVIRYSKNFNVDPILVLSVIWKESHFNPKAQNGKFIGLMQINFIAHRDSLKAAGIDSINELFDIEKNIAFGVAMLRGAFKKTPSRQQALMLYNRSVNAREYSLEVMELYNRLMQQFNK